jgi:hypothetical protein
VRFINISLVRRSEIGGAGRSGLLFARVFPLKIVIPSERSESRDLLFVRTRILVRAFQKSLRTFAPLRLCAFGCFWYLVRRFLENPWH